MINLNLRDQGPMYEQVQGTISGTYGVRALPKVQKLPSVQGNGRRLAINQHHTAGLP